MQKYKYSPQIISKTPFEIFARLYFPSKNPNIESKLPKIPSKPKTAVTCIACFATPGLEYATYPGIRIPSPKIEGINAVNEDCPEYRYAKTPNKARKPPSIIATKGMLLRIQDMLPGFSSIVLSYFEG